MHAKEMKATNEDILTDHENSYPIFRCELEVYRGKSATSAYLANQAIGEKVDVVCEAAEQPCGGP
jgi:hypothetical protein